MSIPYKLMKNKFHITIIAKSWPMKFVMQLDALPSSFDRFKCKSKVKITEE
jgi:hypothetical protein